MPAPSAGSNETREWIASYDNKREYEAAWQIMANRLLEDGMTEQYGILGRKEPRGYTLYLVTYDTGSTMENGE